MFSEANKHLSHLTTFERAMFKHIPDNQRLYFRKSDLIPNEEFNDEPYLNKTWLDIYHRLTETFN